MTISDYIRNDLRARIGSEEALSHNLTLTQISAHYQVSLMPVRRAVAELIDERVIAREPNGRLVVNPRRRWRSDTERGEPSPQPPTDWDAVIAREVVVRSLREEEAFLREEATADRLGIGRTVVRRILSRLSGAGMIDHVPRCGWRIRPYRQSDMLAYIDVRETLEIKAIHLARGRLEVAELEALIAANTTDDDTQPRIDNTLHAYWIERSGNRYIRHFFEQQGAYYAALFDYATLAESRVLEMAAEHCDILRKLIDDDFRAAAGTLRRHIRGQRPMVLKLLEHIQNEQS